MQTNTQVKTTQEASHGSDIALLTKSSLRDKEKPRVALLSAQPKRSLLVQCIAFIKRIFTRKKVMKQHEAVASAKYTTAAIVAQLAHVDKPVFKKTTSILVTPMGDYAGNLSKDYSRQLAEREFMALEPSQAVKH